MISVDWTLGLQFVNFMILLLVLNKLLYRPLQQIMKKRKEEIDGSHAEAKNLEAKIEEKMNRYQEQLAAAKTAANAEKALLKQAAVEEEAKILGAAHERATAQFQNIKSQIAAEEKKAGQILKDEAQDLANQIATKVLGRVLI